MHPTPQHLDVTAESFGRDATLFHGLLGFMATLSLALWGVVLLTAVLRFVACNVVYRRRPLQAARSGPSDVDEA
jgi:hypothetical protein